MVMTESLVSWMEDRQSELNDCLLKLANVSPEDSSNGSISAELEDIGLRMVNIYSETYGDIQFRHQYHLLSEVISTLDGEQLDSIPRNLKRYIDYKFKEIQKDDPALKMVKLYDHLSIEIERNRDHSSLKQLSADISVERNNLINVKDNISKLNESLNNHQIQLVSVLGIFSAIIFVFVGGFDFLSSAITSAKETEIHILICTVLVAGFFFLNMIVLLLWVIGKVAHVDTISFKRGYPLVLVCTDVLIISMLIVVVLHLANYGPFVL